SRGPVTVDNQMHPADLGLVLLPALVVLVFVRWSWAVRVVGFAAVWYWVVWVLFFSRTSARYLSTFFLLCAVLGAYGIVSLAGRMRWAARRWALAGVVGVLMAYSVVRVLASLGPYLPTTFALDPEAEKRYLAAYMDD